MTYQWSDKSAFIQSLFRPRTPADGYDEAEIVAAERALGVALPAILRNFYKSWGRHREMTQTIEVLLTLSELRIFSGGLLFCVENQGMGYWAIPIESLRDEDPLVCYGSVASD